MGAFVPLTADDGHHLTAYRADPVEPAKGGIVVIQEIFGVNSHIRRVADSFAAHGYLAIAPALFDRVEPGVELDYQPADTNRGRDLRTAIGWDAPLRDIAAATSLAATAGPVAVIGYCWGGSLAWLAAAQLPGLAAAIGYYGGQITQFLDRTPRVPVLLQFGAHDALIPPADIDRIRAAHPAVPIQLYPADHGFNCDARASYEPASAALALERTLHFLNATLPQPGAAPA